MKKDYLTIKEAAKTLGVSPMTLRRWDRKGKLKATRHPFNNYRIYNFQKLETLLKNFKKSL